MPLLAVKFVLSTLLVGAATIVQRRFGNRASGFLVGLPVTTGPYLFLVALEHGRSFTIQSAQGVLQGQIALVLFCIFYVHAPDRWKWWVVVSSATLFCLIATLLISQHLLPPLLAFALLASVWLLALKSWPPSLDITIAQTHAAWELPMRLAVTVGVLAGLTQIAPLLGASLAGGLATLPVISIVLCGATHRRFGPEGPRQFLRGLLNSLPAAASFSLLLALLARQLNVFLALAFALLATVSVAGVQSRRLREPAGP